MSDDFNWPTDPEHAARKMSISRLALLNAVNRGLVRNDTQGVPHIHIGMDGWMPIPESIRELREAGLVALMYGWDEASRWRHWLLTREGHAALALDAQFCASPSHPPTDRSPR